MSSLKFFSYDFSARADLIRTLELVQNTDMEDSKVDAIMNEIYDYLTY